jgi:hypothetical protein
LGGALLQKQCPAYLFIFSGVQQAFSLLLMACEVWVGVDLPSAFAMLMQA